MASAFKRFFHTLWRGADALRKVLHLLVLLIIFGVALAMLSAGAPKIPESGALLIQPKGALVEQLDGSPLDRALAELRGDARRQTLVTDVLDGLDYAAEDDRITNVVLDLRALGGSGMSTLQRVAAAMKDFRDSGKPIIAHADYFTQGGYFLAAHADEVYMHPRGILLLQGFGAYRNYYKEAIDKLKIDWHVFRAGKFKSAVEPFIRNNMSDEDRGSLSRIIEQLWSTFQEDIVAARGIEPDSIGELIDDFADLALQPDTSVSDIAVRMDFVDGLLTRQELGRLIAKHAGEDEENSLGFAAVTLDDYVAHVRLLSAEPEREQNVAVVVAAGEILDGFQPPGKVGGESTADLLARARKDESIKAVVLRIDSPGGSVFASELLRHEILALRQAGKPVVASMGSVAASGGYWIAMSTDRILATESTITGSIGVYGMFPTFERTLGSLGINSDGVATTPIAAAPQLDRTLNDDMRRIVQAIVDDDYQRFVGLVAEDRNLERDAVERIAQGQIWTGREALANGLVDEIGDFEEAVRVAAGLAGLEEGSYGRRYIEKDLTPTEMLTLQLIGGARAIGLSPGLVGSGHSSLERIAGQVERMLAPLLRFNDPRGSYAHCFCDLSGMLAQ